MELGEYLRKIRKENKKTLVQLANETGLSHSYLSQVENGKKLKPSMEALRKIAEACDQSSLDLWGKAGYMTEEDVLKQKEMKQETYSRFDDLFKDGGAYITEENKDILTKMKTLEEHGFIPEEETQKQNESIKTKNEKPVIFAQDDILFQLKSPKTVYLNFKPLKDEDRQRMSDLLKAAFPEYFK